MPVWGSRDEALPASYRNPFVLADTGAASAAFGARESDDEDLERRRRAFTRRRRSTAGGKRLGRRLKFFPRLRRCRCRLQALNRRR